MAAPVGPRLIHLFSLTKSFPAAVSGSRPKLVLHPTTLSLPADRRLAVLAKKLGGKSVFLRILAGVEAPTDGEVISTVRSSPVIKSGVLFHPRISNVENIRFFARMLNLDPDRLTVAIDAFCRANGVAGQWLEDEQQRRAAEVALLTILSFDCYFVDEIGQLAEPARLRLFDVAEQRQGGVIFATNQPRLARRYADCAVVIRDGIVHPFSNVAEAIAFHER
jgi:capsular polysaccharide transport system ATP-binding protein